MTEQTHTRGPWTFESYPFGHKPRVFSPGKLIAEVGNAEDETKFHDEWVANARLIAAAPDMLTALKDLLEVIAVVDRGWGDGNITVLQQAVDEKVFDNARTAIVKAAGKHHALT